MLWTKRLKREFLDSYLGVLDNVTSLAVVSGSTSIRWRTILEKSSRKLKHLNILAVNDGHSEANIIPPDLQFPNLKVLELNTSHWYRDFPR